MPVTSLRRWCLYFGVAALLSSGAMAQGIPEPDLIIYGIIRNTNGVPPIRLGYGTLRWVFQPQGGGPAVVATSLLTNINNQLSYVLRVPCETPVAGFAALTNKLQLTSGGTTFNRALVTWNSNALAFVEPALTNVFLRTVDRGRVERIDLNSSLPVEYDVNGLPLDWELTYFGTTGIDPFADPDADGLNTQAELRTGTDPNDPLSTLRFVEISRTPSGTSLKWLSALDRSYALQRATGATGTYQDIMTAIVSTPSTNTFLDTTASGDGPHFYRLRMDDSLSVPTDPLFLLVSIRSDPLGGVSIDWLSAAGKTYAIQRSTNLASGFSEIMTGVMATPPLNSYQDETATGLGPYFYRLRLETGP